MNRTRPALVFGAVLLISVVWLALCFLIAMDGVAGSSRVEIITGELMAIPGEILSRSSRK